MNQIEEMYDLIEKLNYHTKLYDEGHPQIEDSAWDAMYFKLQKLEEDTGITFADSPTQHISYDVINILNKVTHNHPMLSLQKTKNVDEVDTFLGQQDGIAMLKMDGLTCSITYENGQLIRAETRGNGIIGEDITHNIKFVKGVPLTIPQLQTTVVDGEVICTYDDFTDFENDYKNPRNFASGSIRLLDAKLSAQRKLTFVAWDCIEGINYSSLSDKLITLDTLGFITVPFVFVPYNSNRKIDSIINLMQNIAQDHAYPIDGVVFKYDDCKYYQSLGATEHHFRGGLAFKFYDEEYETKLRGIEWSIGKTGILTPVAKFDPIETEESIIERASLHNLNIMRQVLGNPYAGQKIKVIKANQIIPQVIWGEKIEPNPFGYWAPPTKCPICNGNTFIKDDFLYCENPACEGKLINKLDHFAGKKGLEIKGLSEATLEKLISWGWINSIKDLFNLRQYEQEWTEQPGFGPKSVSNILAAIDRSCNCELWRFISALGIPLIGSTYAKQIAKTINTWHDFRELIEKGFNFAEWDNFGPEMNDALYKFNFTEADEIELKYLNIINTLVNQTVENSNLAGKTIVITGKLINYKNRDLLKADIEAHGGKVGSSITSKTDFLVNNDITSTSSKNVKAKQLDIPIITENELIAMF